MSPKCLTPCECGRPPYALGLCRRHYDRYYRQVGRTAHHAADLLAEVEHLMPDSPETIAARLGVTPGAVAKAAYRAGRRDLGRPFFAADKRARAELRTA